MTSTQPANRTTLLPYGPVRILQRWASAPAAATPRTRRTRRRTSLAQAPAPPLHVWRLDRSEIASVLEHSRW